MLAFVGERREPFQSQERQHWGSIPPPKHQPRPGTNGPLIPGDPEREAEAIRSKEGIPLIKPVVDDLLDISKKTRIAFEVK